jgi:GxxExxY protein
MDRADELRELASQVGQIAYRVHEYFGNGLLEKVYESALGHRLIKAGCKVERQKPLKVFDEDGYCIGDYFVDMLVNDGLIVELKAVKSLVPEHFSQIMNYFKIARNPVGLLINFGSYKFERRTITA